jgi:putative transposase
LTRHEYNTVRLHAGIGYVTPADEHGGRGERIRATRRRGMWLARHKRIEYHRAQRVQRQLPGLDDAG